MKSLFNKIVCFSLAIIVLFSSFSFTINEHICGGKTANTEFFVSADNCGMQMRMCENKSFSKESSVQKETCCNDISILIPNVDTNQQPQNTASSFPLVLVSVLTPFFETQITTRRVSFFAYRPPLIHKDVLAFFQVFRL